jgi:perosamine synthetase
VNTPIPHNAPLITATDRAAVDAVLASGWIAQGPEVAGLESDFDTLYGGGGSCALSSGTAALFLGLKVLGAAPRARVAVPTYACSALLNAVYMAGAEPLVCDVRRHDYNLDPDSLRCLSGGNMPPATIAVHTYGAPADVAAIAECGGAVIEDCCQSLGGKRDERLIGAEGALAVFSFYATKIVTSGQGGMLRDPKGDFATAAHDYRSFDCRETYEPRFNLHMSDIAAATARSQLARLEAIAARRRDIAQRYLAALPRGVEVMAGTGDEGRMVYRFVLEFPNGESRDRARDSFRENDIATIIPLERYELLHRYLRLDPADYPVAEALVDVTLSLPIYPALTEDGVGRICQALSRLEA